MLSAQNRIDCARQWCRYAYPRKIEIIVISEITLPYSFIRQDNARKFETGRREENHRFGKVQGETRAMKAVSADQTRLAYQIDKTCRIRFRAVILRRPDAGPAG